MTPDPTIGLAYGPGWQDFQKLPQAVARGMFDGVAQFVVGIRHRPHEKRIAPSAPDTDHELLHGIPGQIARRLSRREGALPHIDDLIEHAAVAPGVGDAVFMWCELRQERRPSGMAP